MLGTIGSLIQGVFENPLAQGVNWMLGVFKDFVLTILGETVIPLLHNVMAYQNFFSTGVNAGWEITRNFANLFFALILLIIAIATILQIGALDNYTAKRMLPQFIFVALFINFSKAIIGLLIDISQIIMVSLYNTFGSKMTDIIGNASRIAETGAESNTENIIINIFSIAVIAILAFVLLWTSLILAIRIVKLWFIIMLSPLAFMSSLIPGLKSINSEWTKNLQEALITGPTLMFLLYLAFSVMSQGISANTVTNGGNLLNNGNLINYVLTVGLLLMSNTTASKAAEAAPAILQQAVGVAGTLATFGIGAKVGAGGTGFRQGLKDGWSATGGKVVGFGKGTIAAADKIAGGVTRAIQVGSGGKINPNDRYEIAKAKRKKNLEEGKAFGGGYFGSVVQQTFGGEAGRKERFNATQLTMANQAKANDTLHQDPTLLRARNAAVAKATEELKGASVTELIEQFKETTDEIEREAIFAKITELEGLKDLLADDKFKEYAERFETESEQINALISNEFESNRIAPTRSDRDFRSRIAKLGKDKKQEAYISGIDNFNIVRDQQNNITYRRSTISPTTGFEKVKKKDLSSAIADINTNNNLIKKRKKNPNDPSRFTVDQNGRPEYERDPQKVFEFIDSVSSLDTLRDRKTWEKLKPELRSEFLYVLANEIPKDPQNPKYEAAFDGLTS